MRRWACFIVLAAACAPAQQPPSEASRPPSDLPAADRARCSLKLGTAGTGITCLADHAIVMLPVGPWRLEEARPPAFMNASRNYFHVSLRTNGPDETRYPLDEHLRGIYEGIAAVKGAGEAGPPHFEVTPRGRKILFFEVKGLVEDGRPLRSIHVWSALRGPDRAYVDYHSSWTGPADDPEVVPPKGEAPMDLRMVNFADMFFVVDDSGRAPEQ